MVIEDTEIIRYFNDAKEIELNLERMEQIFSFLESHNVDILTITEEDDDEEDDEDEDEEEEEERPRRKKGKSKDWQSKNFLDDDDLEFEFLDLK